ncbi:MFS transporter [Loigolactobacillus jiayinensis]|uniref:MFS transporter n=1 Tax=Loigolactobacillus jiayinensis TaxID=2486016 RepID=A0ABW1R9Q3_9LACO|nr:MFS transporter [Loigolactobacillus jiayinensis]
MAKDEKETPKIVNAKVSDEQQPKLPWMFSWAMFLAPMVWYGPNIAVRNTLIPQLFSQIDPANKVWAFGIISAAATFTGAITNLVFGALSDVTRSRWGKRKPYITIGTLVMAIMMVIIANISSVTTIIFLWIICAAGENAVAASIYAQISDRIAPKWRGTASTFYGVGFTISQQAFTILAAQFLGNVKFGIYAMALISVILGIVHLLLSREQSNMAEPAIAINKKTFSKYFFFPTKGARDFYLALFGKFFMVVGSTIVTTYTLYLFTDYMGLNSHNAGKSVSIFSTLMLVIGVIFALISGPLADRAKRIKLPVMFATFLLGFAALFPLFIVHPWAMYTYAAIAAVGNGIYNSVDGALNLDVLPSSDTAGKDLGLINLANTLSQMVGALSASAIVSTWGYQKIFVFAIILEVIGAILIALIRSVK